MSSTAKALVIPVTCASLILGGMVMGGLNAASMALVLPAGACELPDDSYFQTADGGCKELSNWMVFSASPPSSNYHWADASAYCNDLVEGDSSYADWVLPSKDELLQVGGDAGGSGGDYLDGYVEECLGCAHWSGTKSGNKYWAVTFDPLEAFQSNASASTLRVYCRRYSGPANLTATAISTTQIDLTWADNAEVETGFVLQWSLNQTSWNDIALVGSNPGPTKSYSHGGLTKDTTYYYRVKATGTVTDSPLSSTVSAKTKRR